MKRKSKKLRSKPCEREKDNTEKEEKKSQRSKLFFIGMRRSRIVAQFGDAHVGPVPAKLMASDVRLVLISDTHNVETDVSSFPDDADVIVHAGDHTVAGTRQELENAAKWLGAIARQRAKHGAVLTGGNHDVPLDRATFQSVGGDDALSAASLEWFNTPPLRFVNHGLVEVAGLRLFLSPFVPLTPSRQHLARDNPERNVGFNREDSELDVLYSQIPDDVDVLVTHTPPFGILDKSLQYGNVKRKQPIEIGSKVLLSHVKRVRPLIHVFGHEHDSRGMHEQDGTLFINVR
jgi:hypothetical protein